MFQLFKPWRHTGNAKKEKDKESQKERANEGRVGIRSNQFEVGENVTTEMH